MVPKPTYKELEKKIQELELSKFKLKTAERTLRENEKKYRFLAETMNDIVWTTDMEFKTTYVSPSIERTLGFTPEERYKQSVEEMITPESLEKARAALLKVIEQQENEFSSHQEFKLIDIEFYTKDGSTLWIENNVKFIHDSENNITGLMGVSRDITRRMQAEESLKNEKLWIQGIFNALDTSVHVVTPDRKLINVNPATSKIFGYSENELLNQSTEILHVDHERYIEFGRRINKSFSKNESAHFEFLAKRKNGEIFSSEHIVSQLKNDSGEPIGIVSIVHDITERKKMEEVLKKTEKRYRRLVEQSPGISYHYSQEHGATFWSSSTKEILGHSPKEVIKNPFLWNNSIHPDDINSVNEAIKNALLNKPYDLEYRIKDKAGEWHWFHDRSIGIIKDDDSIIIEGLAFDITDRKQSEEKVLEAEKRYRTLFEHAADSIFLIDPETGTFLDFNKKAYKNLGHTRKEFGKLNLSDIDADESPDKVKKHIETIMKNGTDIFETRHLTKNGQIRNILVNASAISMNNKKMIHSICHDFTQRKQAEQELKYSKRQLEAIHNNIDSFIYVADMKSHEILFINNHMQELFGKDLAGTICWKSLHNNQGGPCEFCTNDKLIDADGNPTNPHVWEFYNQKLKRWYELHDLAVPWVTGNLVRMEIATDITDRKKIEETQKKWNELLEEKIKERTSDLEDVNTALRVMLTKREEDKNQIGENIYANFKSIILPLLYQLRNSHTKNVKTDILEILETSIKEMVTPFSKKLSDPMMGLTPTEILVANLVKEGKTNKETAQILSKSLRTISAHRENIRKKFDLKNQKINLRTYLLSIN